MAVAKQGHGDSLCGIYSLLNVMASFEKTPKKWESERHRVMFGQLIMAADKLGYLDLYHLTVGFEAFELRELFDWVVERFSYGLVSRDLHGAPQSPHALVKYDQDNDHWVAISSKGELLDSWPFKASVNLKKALEASEGFAIERTT